MKLTDGSINSILRKLQGVIDAINANGDWFANLAQGFSIAASIATCIGIWFVYMQMKRSKDERVADIHHNAVRTAVEVAQKFQNELIPKMKFIIVVYGIIGYSDLIPLTISDLPAADFCQTGLGRFTSEQLNTETTICNSLCCKHYVFAYSRVPQILHILNLPHFSDNEQENDVQVKAHFDGLLKDVLNTLEWVSMLIDTGTADGDTIYESLHHIFVPFVRANYFHYAKLDNADKPEDKYFTYTKRVYETWRLKENAVKDAAKAKATDTNEKNKSVDNSRKSEYTATVSGE